MSKLCVFLIFLFILREISGVIYHLNDTEYEKLPRLFELDNYETCKEEPDSVYCVANLEIYTDSPNEIYILAQEYSAFSLKHYNYLKPDKGVCVTKKCKSYAENAGLDINRDLESVLEGCLNETMNNKYNLSARLMSMHCQEETNVDTLDYVFLFIVVIILLLNIIGTCYDSFLNKNKDDASLPTVQKLLLIFSVFKNMKVLKSDEGDDTNNDLNRLYGIRLLGCLIVVLVHMQLTIAFSFTADPHTFEKAFDFVAYQMILSNMCAIQVFFIISGLLLTYTLEKYSKRFNLTWKSLPKIVLLRWWRLTPSAAVVLGFMATWMRHVSNGPVWRLFITNGPFAQCRQYFWAHMFYFNNYLLEDEACAFQTWYIAAEFQLFILGLIVHFFVKNRSLKFKITTLALLALTGSFINIMHVWRQDLDAFSLVKPEYGRSLSDPTFRILHIQGHNNITCFIMGMANGYLVNYLQQKKGDWSYFKMGKFFDYLAIALFEGVAYCGTFFYQDGERSSVFTRMTYTALSKLAMGIIVTAWSSATVLKFTAFSQNFLGNYICMVLSKLSYGVFLVHLVFIYILAGTRTQLTPVSFINCFFAYIGVLVSSFVVALLLYLLVEVPAYQTIRVLLNKEIKKKNS